MMFKQALTCILLAFAITGCTAPALSRSDLNSSDIWEEKIVATGQILELSSVGLSDELTDKYSTEQFLFMGSVIKIRMAIKEVFTDCQAMDGCEREGEIVFYAHEFNHGSIKQGDLILTVIHDDYLSIRDYILADVWILRDVGEEVCFYKETTDAWGVRSLQPTASGEVCFGY